MIVCGSAERIKVTAYYMAGPIDAVTAAEARDWQDRLAKMTPDMATYSPAHPFRNASLDHAPFIDEINRAAIRAARCVVAYLPPKRPAFGTIREIEYSVSLGFPTLIVAPDGIKSLLQYDLTVCDSLEKAALLLRKWNAWGLQ